METENNEGLGLVKLPETIKSPEGTQVEAIKNYKNEVIGERTYNCGEGESRI